MDNGACYQLVTQRIYSGFSSTSPTLSKKLFNELKKLQFIKTNESLRRKAKDRYNMGNTKLTYWEFDILRMSKIGYETIED